MAELTTRDLVIIAPVDRRQPETGGAGPAPALGGTRRRPGD